MCGGGVQKLQHEIWELKKQKNEVTFIEGIVLTFANRHPRVLVFGWESGMRIDTDINS